MHNPKRLVRVDKTKIPVFFLILFSGIINSSCEHEEIDIIEKPCLYSNTIENTYTVDEISENIGDFGDSKLVVFENEVYIISTLTNILHIKKINDFNSSFKSTSPNIQSNWLAVIEDKGSILCITASFSDRSLRLYKIDMQSLNVNLLGVVHQYDGELLIDPTFVKVDDTYLITYTKINGNINNGDITKPNGHYEVILLESNDLISWKEVSSIVNEDTNIEDGFLYFDRENNSLFFLYEEEVYDKKNSSIKIKKSIDRGENWGESIILLSASADQEPAAIFYCNEQNYLFYSSDLDNKGASYYGAKGYVSSFNNLNFTPEQVNISLRLDTGIILYDVILNNNKLYFLANRLNADNSNVLVHYTFK